MVLFPRLFPRFVLFPRFGFKDGIDDGQHQRLDVQASASGLMPALRMAETCVVSPRPAMAIASSTVFACGSEAQHLAAVGLLGLGCRNVAQHLEAIA